MVNVKGKVCPVLDIILIKFLLSRAHVNQECKWFGHSTLDIYDPFQRGVEVVLSKKKRLSSYFLLTIQCLV